MPRNEAENQIYFDLISIRGHGPRVWLDIVEVQPRTSPRSWVYKDGSPVTWFNWSFNWLLISPTTLMVTKPRSIWLIMMENGLIIMAGTVIGGLFALTSCQQEQKTIAVGYMNLKINKSYIISP